MSATGGLQTMYEYIRNVQQRLLRRGKTGSVCAELKRCLACASHPEAVLERQNPFELLTAPGFIPHNERSIVGDVLTLNGRARSSVSLIHWHNSSRALQRGREVSLSPI
jgi:hypothetical protein